MSRKAKLKDVSTVLSEALALSLADRVKIREEISLSIDNEVHEKRLAAQEAEKISKNGTKPSS